MLLFTRAFWASISWALVRTAMAGLVPFIPGLAANPAGTWQVAALTVSLALVLTVATSLGGLPDGSGPWWEVALLRGLRQFGQMITAAAAGAVLLTDISWHTVLITAAGSALSTIVIAALSTLPVATPSSEFPTPRVTTGSASIGAADTIAVASETTPPAPAA